MSLTSAWSHHLRHSLLDLIYDDLRLSRADGGVTEFSVDGLRVECWRGWPDRPELADQWGQLWAACPQATPFHSYTWQQSLYNSLYQQQFRLVLIYEDQRLTGAVALRIDAEGYLETIGADLSDYLEPLIHPEDRERCWKALMVFFRNRWDRRLKGIHFHNFRPDTPCLKILPMAADEEGFDCDRREMQSTAQIVLSESWEAYLGSLHPHQRKELRRKIKKARAAGAQLACCDDPRQIEREMPGVLEIMSSHDRSKRKAVKGVLNTFLSISTGPLAENRLLKLYRLMVKGEMAAALIVLPTPAGPMLWNCGYSEKFASISPGIVTFAWTIQQAIEHGSTVVDLLRGPEPYKLHLGASQSSLYRLTLTLRP